MCKRHACAIAIIALLSITTTAKAQWAVVDVGAITQLIEQISYWKQQIQGMTDQLGQLKTSYDSTTGTRGMERLLSGTVRNYLPSDWAALADSLQGLSNSYSGLSVNLRGAMNENAVLSDEQLARLSPAARQEIQRERELAAMTQVTAREALSNTSQRFASIQQLINAIPQATDQKAILDLQSRIGAEQAMLQNEQTKLQMLNQSLAAEEMARKQRIREKAIADIGSFRNLPPLELP